jgi:hypothetical protein
MLQRKQTVWMLLAAICAALSFRFHFYHGNVVVGDHGHELRELRAYPTYLNGTSGSILITIVTVVIIVGALWNMFNFKNRTRQFWVTNGLIFLSLLNILLYWIHSGKPDFIEGDPSLTAIFVLAIPVFLFFAAGGIRKDEKLVKSADRLR